MSETNPIELVTAGRILETHHEWNLAGNIYIHFLKQNIHLPEAYIGLSRVLAAQGKNQESLEALERGAARTRNTEVLSLLQANYEKVLENKDLDPQTRYDTALRAAQRGLTLNLATKVLIRNAAPLKRHVETAGILQELRPHFSDRPEQDEALLHAIALLFYQGGYEKQAREALFTLLQKNSAHPGGKRLFATLCSQ